MNSGRLGRWRLLLVYRSVPSTSGWLAIVRRDWRAWLALIRLLRQAKLVAAEIAARLPIARSTVSAVLVRLGLSRLRYLNPPPLVRRYEWSRPGELVHMDIKKLGRIAQPSHRVTGNRRHSLGGV